MRKLRLRDAIRDGEMETQSNVSWFRGIVLFFLTSQEFGPSVKLFDLTTIHWAFFCLPGTELGVGNTEVIIELRALGNSHIQCDKSQDGGKNIVV